MVYFTVGVWRCLKLVNQERPTLFYLCNACSGLGVIIVFDMKKIYFCLLACVVAFAGCSKDEDPGRSYTEQQEKALSVFNGTWADTQFSNLGGRVFNTTQRRCTKIGAFLGIKKAPLF